MNTNRWIRWSQYIFGVYLLFFIYSLIGRYPHLDDAWLGEHAYWQAKLGYVKSELMRGLHFPEIRYLCHHKLFTLQAAHLIKLFGFNLYILKSIPLLYFIVFILLFYYGYFHQKPDRPYFLLGLLLILCNNDIFTYSFTYRPEISAMCFGFICFLFLEKCIINVQKSAPYAIIAGLMAGFSAASHLNALIFPFAGVILLFINKKYQSAILFSISFIPSFCIYFYDFTSVYNFEWWAFQVTPAYGKYNNLPDLFYFFKNLWREQLRFFHSPQEISLTLLTLALIFYSVKKIPVEKYLIHFLLLLMLGLALIAVHKTPYYMILYLPYVFILIIRCLCQFMGQSENINQKHSWKKYLIVLLLLFYFGSHTWANIELSMKKFNSDREWSEILGHLPENREKLKIIAPLQMIFYEIENFERIQGNWAFAEMPTYKIDTYQEKFLMKADQFEIDYIILNGAFIKKFGMHEMTKEKFNRYKYHVVVSEPHLLILQKYNF